MSDVAESRLGLSGAIAKKFLLSEITPLLALVGLLMGVFAVLITPREEEPQINVTFANVFIPFPGATAREVERLVSSPAEQVLAEIEGVEHVYSISRPGLAVLTVQFFVGEPRTDAIVRLYNKLYSNADWLPANLGVGQPIVKPKGIDDVPIVALTLWTEDPQRGADDLARVAHTLETELKRVPGTRDLYTIGAPDRVVQVRFDPAKLSKPPTLRPMPARWWATTAKFRCRPAVFWWTRRTSVRWWWACIRVRRSIWLMSLRSSWSRIHRNATSGWVRDRWRRPAASRFRASFPP